MSNLQRGLHYEQEAFHWNTMSWRAIYEDAFSINDAYFSHKHRIALNLNSKCFRVTRYITGYLPFFNYKLKLHFFLAFSEPYIYLNISSLLKIRAHTWIEWQDILCTYPTRIHQKTATFVTKTNQKAIPQWTRKFSVPVLGVMSYITMNVIELVNRLTSRSMRLMNYVRYKCSVSVVTCLYFQSYNHVHSFVHFINCLIFIGCHGSYGDGCHFPCPINCLDGKCDAYSGQCISCRAGYYGQTCEYGLNFYYY